MKSMRIALVSPYSWTYPGGVTRHIEALAEQLIAEGHFVRVLAPFDPPDQLAGVLHRGARPQALELPEYLVPLGRTIGIKANGAVSNLSITPSGIARMHHALRSQSFDVVHIQEPIAPILCWVATDQTRLPLVGTFHTYSTSRVLNGGANLLGARRMLNRLHVRIAVSEAAAWTNQRFFGGHYRLIPNGVHYDREAALAAAARPLGEALRIAFVGQAVERKGLPVLLRAFEALRDHIPCELTLIGPTPAELEPLLLDGRAVRALGKVSDAEKQAELERADVLCAPSLGGESFGMVLTEAFAAGTPVVASDIAGYRHVVRDGVDGMLVPRGDAQALAETLRDLWHDPARLRALALAGAERAERFAWPHVAAEVLDAYEDAIATPAPEGVAARAAVRLGTRPADLKPRAPARRLQSLEPAPVAGRRSVPALLRRGAMVAVTLIAAALGVFALQKIGLQNIASALISSDATFVVIALAVMCAAMALRSVSWLAILRAALPNARIRLADSMQGTFIGVLMSSTLPARLGEPSRALMVARRTGRPRENLPVVLGTIVSQTLLNLVALLILAAIMFSSAHIFSGHQDALMVAALAPAVMLVVVLLAPSLLRGRGVAKRLRFEPLQSLLAHLRGALARVRTGLVVFRQPRNAAVAAVGQLAAWAMQCLSCYLLLIALGLDNHTGIGAAAAVLFAVNITAVVPATPANLGVFQAAAATVLHAGWHVSFGDGVAYGVILQAVEVATAVLMGGPALLKEGMSWREIKLRAMHATPVNLPPLSRPVAAGGGREALESES